MAARIYRFSTNKATRLCDRCPYAADRKLAEAMKTEAEEARREQIIRTLRSIEERDRPRDQHGRFLGGIRIWTQRWKCVLGHL
jgi:hypothetical protein